MTTASMPACACPCRPPNASGRTLPATPPRPEFHDFGIADLPAPDAELAARPLRALEVVAFDTQRPPASELRRGDTVISIGACRIVNARLLASEIFDLYGRSGQADPAGQHRHPRHHRRCGGRRAAPLRWLCRASATTWGMR